MTPGTRTPTRAGLRVVLHVHSAWSYDGHWQLARVARLFGRLGAGAVMMTEHDTGFAPEGLAQARFAEYRAACAAASTRACRLIPGIEYSDPGNDVHILTWGLGRFLGAGRPVEATLADVREAGGVAVLAHPARRDAWRLFRDAWVPLLDGVEIWNRKTDGLAPGVQALALQTATGLAPTVGVDFHRLRHFYPLDHLADAAAWPGDAPGDAFGDAPGETRPEAGPEAGLEAGLVRAIRAGGLVPRAWGRPLVRAGRPIAGATGFHHALEGARRTLKRALRDRPRGR
jgi:predicted metal-dependent phosphoesterase TrpH